jgi:hypothetical protein
MHLGIAMEIIAFVDDEFPVRFISEEGTFAKPGGGADVGPNLQCSEDPDCDGNPATEGDGIVAARLKLLPDSPTSGSFIVTVIQEGIGFPITINVVGPPETITLSPLFGKATIQTGATQGTPGSCGGKPCQNPDPTDCNFAASVDGVLGANNDAEKAVIVAKALDNDGNEVVGALLAWNHSFEDNPTTVPAAPDLGPLPQGGVALPLTPTIDTGALGIAFPQFVCGGDTPGPLKLEVTFSGPFDNLIPQAVNEKTTITINVIGPATQMVLTADPPEIDCDGVKTSTITAKVTNAAGENVANGLDVNFETLALGTVNPLKTNAADGVASTVLTPLAGAGTVTAGGQPVGVVVKATAKGQVHALFGQPRTQPQVRHDLVEQSILVRCTGVLAQAVQPAAGTSAGAGAQPTGTIRGPDTGSGGVAGAGSLTWWPAVALVAAATLLGVTRMTLATMRRR